MKPGSRAVQNTSAGMFNAASSGCEGAMYTILVLLCGLVAYGSASTCENVCTPVCTGATAGGGALIGDIPGAIVGGALSGTCSPVCHTVCTHIGKRDVREWFETKFPAHVADYDQNGDRQISLREFAAGFHGRHEDFATRHVFNIVDRDGDGFISAVELARAPLKFE